MQDDSEDAAEAYGEANGSESNQNKAPAFSGFVGPLGAHHFYQIHSVHKRMSHDCLTGIMKQFTM